MAIKITKKAAQKFGNSPPACKTTTPHWKIVLSKNSTGNKPAYYLDSPDNDEDFVDSPGVWNRNMMTLWQSLFGPVPPKILP